MENRHVTYLLIVFPMRTKLRTVVAIWLVALIEALAAEPITWSAEIAMDDQIFPSLTYAMANLKAENMVIGKRKVARPPADFAALDGLARRPFVVRFNRLARGSKASVRISAEGLIKPVSTVVDLGFTQVVAIPVSFLHEQLVRVRQSKPAAVEFVVSIDGGPARKVAKPVTIRSINDCPFYYVSKTSGRGHDLSWMFAAYVNEDHPLIDEILKRALSTGIVSSFAGYQSKNIDEVRDQVRAVWTALSMMGIRYSSITASANRSDVAISTHVRLVGESSRANQANCADGSVLVASVLEKIGIETELIHVPGHMYVRFWLNPWEGEKRLWCCLETTLLGAGFPTAKAPKSQVLAAAGKSYVEAWTSANAEFEKVQFKFGSNDSRYKIVSIAEARRRGVIPIPATAAK